MIKSGFLILLILALAIFPGYGQDSDGKTVVIKTRCLSTNQEIGEPLFVVFVGEFMGKFELKDIAGLNPDQIKEMKVLRTPEAIEEYGDCAKSGAILIWLKEEAIDQLPKSVEKGLSKIESSDLIPL